ncbi:hypothetical protein K470DRAFT_258668 [Piedraia hortae CBS 480.64]|uniref:Extracellular membrane protein CFEM domain-containing protein n=1 Tax=Piedraia hortae CBS 480.64 TaxID=1314780 RepID=A0A6A7BX37_9PEZI|nr:hypothetical protein K470DRAFT_258668 [Piedraia hortae CBS 480.64]
MALSPFLLSLKWVVLGSWLSRLDHGHEAPCPCIIGLNCCRIAIIWNTCSCINENACAVSFANGCEADNSALYSYGYCRCRWWHGRSIDPNASEACQDEL